MIKKPFELSEAQEQEALFRWAKFNEKKMPELKLLFAIPNGAFFGAYVGGKRMHNIGHAVKMRRQGLKKGVPDLFLPVARKTEMKLYETDLDKKGEEKTKLKVNIRQLSLGLFIEMKKKGGRLSVDQKEWQAALLSQGYLAVVCEGWEAAAQGIESYLSLEK